MDEGDHIRRYMSKYKAEKIEIFQKGKIKGNKREKERNAFCAPSDTENKSRNLSEKKRRDQFNMLINELSSMVCPTSRKMDKSSILRATISFLKNHTELSVQSQNVEVQENWKPPFLSNEEFTHLMLEALDGFIIVFSCNGQILYSSESTASFLGYLPSRIYSSVFDIIHERDKSYLYKLISSAPNSSNNSLSKESYTSLRLYMKRGPIHSQGNNSYELVNLIGTFYHWPSNVEGSNPSGFDCDSNSCSSISSPLPSAGVEWRSCFIAIGRLQTPHLLRVVNLPDDTKNEFTSRHSLEWKFLFLDHRAPPIIGYLPFEVLGTSGYDYYHVDDLDNIASSHELLMQTGEGTSCYYRFLTKGQQWIWLQTRYYISYHQWNSKPEFIVCTHTVVSTEKVLKSMQETPKRYTSAKSNCSNHQQINTPPSQSACISPSPSVSSLGSISSEHSEQCSVKTGSSSIRVSTVLYSSQGNKEKMATSPLARAQVPQAAPVIQDNFIEPHPHLVHISSPPATGMNAISSSDRSGLPPTSYHDSQAYPPVSGVYSNTSPSSIIISTNVSGSQFQGQRIQPEMRPEDIEYLSRKYEMLERQIMMSQEELKRVSRQLQMAGYNRNVMPSSGEVSYEPSEIQHSSISSYVNTYSAPSSSHMLAPIPVSSENVIKSVDGYITSSQSYISSSSYQNLEADLCNVSTSGGLPLLPSEQNSDVIAQSYSMTHSMHPNS